MSGENGLNLMLQYQPCIPEKCHVIVNLFYNFEVKLWKRYHITMNSPHLKILIKLGEHWYNLVVSTSRRRGEFDVAVSTLYQRCHCHTSMTYCELKLLSNAQAMLARRIF